MKEIQLLCASWTGLDRSHSHTATSIRSLKKFLASTCTCGQPADPCGEELWEGGLGRNQRCAAAIRKAYLSSKQFAPIMLHADRCLALRGRGSASTPMCPRQSRSRFL